MKLLLNLICPALVHLHLLLCSTLCLLCSLLLLLHHLECLRVCRLTLCRLLVRSMQSVVGSLEGILELLHGGCQAGVVLLGGGELGVEVGGVRGALVKSVLQELGRGCILLCCLWWGGGRM